ncbi:hypothetical protein [Noviherbaspirillum pedocola]|uniref:Uncharacterized protein n=1 Tax=Noviherbaspirillum pedocola TaxID=2801341 RepID=A0A934T0Z8_9BURK|nr:hypothetical protein [Noviherbaspirillum pedocola]MBK4735428.1 hypothetical protein [Noviherbaspirillum pedocola]
MFYLARTIAAGKALSRRRNWPLLIESRMQVFRHSRQADSCFFAPLSTARDSGAPCPIGIDFSMDRLCAVSIPSAVLRIMLVFLHLTAEAGGLWKTEGMRVLRSARKATPCSG